MVPVSHTVICFRSASIASIRCRMLAYSSASLVAIQHGFGFVGFGRGLGFFMGVLRYGLIQTRPLASHPGLISASVVFGRCWLWPAKPPTRCFDLTGLSLVRRLDQMKNPPRISPDGRQFFTLELRHYLICNFAAIAF